MQVIQHELDFPPAGSKELLGNPVVLMLRRIGADGAEGIGIGQIFPLFLQSTQGEHK